MIRHNHVLNPRIGLKDTSSAILIGRYAFWSKDQVAEAECALRWLVHHSKLEQDCGDAVIIGASNLEHLIENLEDVEEQRLRDEVVVYLDKAWAKTKDVVRNYFH